MKTTNPETEAAAIREKQARDLDEVRDAMIQEISREIPPRDEEDEGGS